MSTNVHLPRIIFIYGVRWQSTEEGFDDFVDFFTEIVKRKNLFFH